MPFDGTNLDETTQILIRAKEILLRDGWCINLHTDAGRHCVIGAIITAKSEMKMPYEIIWTMEGPLWDRLAGEIPRIYLKLNPEGADRGCYGPAARAATYNNAQLSVEPILELLDKAIASG